MEDFRYRVEYAKSGRASCRGCKDVITKETLRLAVILQSSSFDGKITHWYHMACFFKKQKPSTVDEIAHFQEIRWEDQQEIKNNITNGTGALSLSRKKGKVKVDSDFAVEYAKSARAVCKGCEEKILKGVVRICKKDYEGEKAQRFGPIPMWHHVDCFVGCRLELDYTGGADNLPGFHGLESEDKKELKQKIEPIDSGKRKNEDTTDSTSAKKAKVDTEEVDTEVVEMKQNKILFTFRDQLNANLKKQELVTLLEYNNYPPFTGESRMKEILADLMTFGVIPTCNICKEGKFIFRSGVGYVCMGNISEFTNCTNVEDKPKRTPFKVPKEFKEEFPFLKKYKYKSNGDRFLKKRAVKESKSTHLSNGMKCLPLSGLSFVIAGTGFNKTKKEMKESLTALGAVVSTEIISNTAAVIVTKGTFSKGKQKHLAIAEEKGVECVPEEFIETVEGSDAFQTVAEMNMATWEARIAKRLGRLFKSKSAKSGESKDSMFKSNMPETMKVTLKDGDCVDPVSKLDDKCHVYKAHKKVYSVVLGLVDISRGLNSFYKMQLLESDKKNKWYLFRHWGRIGTSIGEHKLETMTCVEDAVNSFRELYVKKTSNCFDSDDQTKKPGAWYRMDIDHGQKSVKGVNLKESKSKLPQAVKELVALIFDVDSMKSAMVEYELDLKKMPLGKLSQKQLETSYKVLSEAMECLKAREDKKNIANDAAHKARIVDCSTRFYTLIPHDFGMGNPPLLDNEELIKSKIEMVSSLCEIEVAYSLLREGSDDSKTDSLDRCYKKLKTDIQVLQKDTKEFETIAEYIKNTHASTHTHYTLKLDEVFKIDRSGEKRRFKPFSKLHNRQLLWHGSRLTNFVGILSQGLRIAPPEAPSTGYMFGKGVYFADMVSKSANYCNTSKRNPTGLLMLCDVALGDMYELKTAQYITKLPSGKHSTKGIGQTCPDPSKVTNIDGASVPLGKPLATKEKSSLLYNEYIVYDIAQINSKYLLKTSFKYKY